jgi:hypothetical protein
MPQGLKRTWIDKTLFLAVTQVVRGGLRWHSGIIAPGLGTSTSLSHAVLVILITWPCCFSRLGHLAMWFGHVGTTCMAVFVSGASLVMGICLTC